MSVAEPRLRRPSGTDDPLRVLMLHGLGGKTTVWDRLADRADRTLELWDVELPWRAMAGSESWGTLPDPAQFLVDLVGEDTGRFDAVLAHSYAANLLTEAMAEDRIAPRPTVLISPFYRSSPQDFDWSVISYYLNDFHRVFEEALEVGETGRFGKAHRDWMALRLRDQIGPYGWMRFFEAYLRSPFIDRGAVRSPLLVLSGEKDIAARPGDGRALAAGIPDARYELLAGCGHFPMVERPDLVTRLVCDFLAGAGRPQRCGAAASRPSPSSFLSELEMS
ncbi:MULTISPECIES: alpha/beta fold hydrolase [Streptomyces]|uniref:Alpha/beta fold hydrolase n=1 Tax=Streptomyces lycii TaxID=2654337 RepID=A0ABQ7FD37_9ACTN|nr:MULTISPECIES: alpha/beta hydrolase [Streptomyces]KAF4406767.1 alpha/beta fold hydrolase [Streptomyces lycii]PGH48382.1 hydrolase [Streptomyces sp. Ru87]